MVHPEKQYEDYWRWGVTTPQDFEELIQELFKNQDFVRLLREFVQKEISEDFKGRNNIP